MGRKDKPINNMTDSLQARMRQVRQLRGISLTALAIRTGFTKGHLSSIENGSGTPSEELIRAYERELELDAGTLVSLLGDVSAPRGRRHRSSANGKVSSPEHHTNSIKNKDIVNAPVIKQLHGRKVESADLKKWVISDRCKLISIVGMSGMGKTTIVAHLIGQIDKNTIDHDFEYIAWYSLQDAPLVNEVIERFNNRFFVDQPSSSETEQPGIDTLIELFNRNRCLLVLDDFEYVFADKNTPGAGQYKEKHTDYAKLLQRVGEGNHQSCLILISRERPGEEIRRIEGPTLPVRSMELAGITTIGEVKSFLEGEKLSGTDETWKELIDRYSGNPLALKFISIRIQEIFGGDIATFLSQGETTFGDLSTLLDEPFERLSDDERYLIYWLAIERGSVSHEDLKKDVSPRLSLPGPLGIINSLKQRFLIDLRDPDHVALQPVVLSYVTNRLIQNVCAEIIAKKPDILGSHALVKAQVEDRLRNEQIQHILLPITNRLVELLGSDGVEQHLSEVLKELQATPEITMKTRYTAGNILNLLVQLKEGDLRNFDFSRLTVQQGYLQRTTLHNVNFSYANLSSSVFTETFSGVTSLALSPDSKLLAAGTITGDIWIWDVSSGFFKAMYRGDASWVCWSVTFSPDGRLLASGSEDNVVRLWDVQRGLLVQELRGHTGSVSAVAFSPDGTLLVSGSEDMRTLVWDVSNARAAKLLNTLSGHQGKIWAIAFHPHTDRMLLATGSDDGAIILWNAQTGEQRWTLPEEKPSVYDEPVYALAFSPNGKWLASGGKDCTVRIWDVDKGVLQRMLEEHSDWVWSVAFSPDSNTLASGSEDQSIRTWDIKTGKRLHILSGHTGRVWAVAFHIQQDIFVSGGIDGTIRFWNVQRGECLRILHGYMNGIRSIAYNPRKKILASAGEDYNIYLWNISNDDLDNYNASHQLSYKMLTGHTNVVWAVAFHPDGQFIITGGDDKVLRFWDVKTRTLLDARLEHDTWIRTLSFSPDGERFASGGDDGVIHLWDTWRRTNITRLKGHKNSVRAMAFHPNTTLLASGDEVGAIHLWQLDNLQSTELTRQGQTNTHGLLAAHERGVWSLAFSPDGKLLASGSQDQTIRLWDVRSGRHVNTLQGKISWVGAVAFHPINNNILASGGGDNTVRLWDIKTGRIVATLRGHTGPISSIAFITDDGNRLASGSHDGTIIIWDTQAGNLIRILQADRPYEHMNISHVKGLNDAQIRMFKALGAVSEE